jgi:urease accessory protein
MTIVEEIRPISGVSSQYPNYRSDTVTLTWEERRQGHGKRRSDGGIDFAISLHDGVVMRNGDCFVLEKEETIVKVREALEPVYVIRPESTGDWAFYSYHAGNRHLAIMIGDEELILLQSPASRSLLEQLHAAYTADSRPFSGTLVNPGHGQ